MSEIKELYNRKDQMIHFTLADGMVRGLLCTAVNTVAEGAAIHCATPVIKPSRSLCQITMLLVPAHQA